MTKPILVLQMQRMGDLILSFPLFMWLARRFPGRPVWVVAEEAFFRGLLPLSPHVMYVPWEQAGGLQSTPFELVVNLSHRPEAAELAGRLEADEVVGPLRTAGGVTYIRGGFQLYRAALTHCNRHNRFHWADLNALDVIPLADMAATAWPQPRTLPDSARSVGLFLGASEPAKRPPAAFWASLLAELVRRGLNPVLLGGPGEVDLGRRVAERYGRRVLNQCGRLSLSELAAALQSLSLLVTADTGPMHLGAWVGTRVLNLSMGPVNPWETGPYQPGHTVLRPSASCAGCWECRQAEPPCREGFSPARVASLAARLRSGGDAPASLRFPGQRLASTARDAAGLYDLRPARRCAGGLGAAAREAVSRLWQDYFGWALGLWGVERPASAMAALRQGHEKAALALRRDLAALARELTGNGALEASFWTARPPLARPLASYLQMLLHNGDAGPAARRGALELLEAAASL